MPKQQQNSAVALAPVNDNAPLPWVVVHDVQLQQFMARQTTPFGEVVPIFFILYKNQKMTTKSSLSTSFGKPKDDYQTFIENFFWKNQQRHFVQRDFAGYDIALDCTNIM